MRQAVRIGVSFFAVALAAAAASCGNQTLVDGRHIEPARGALSDGARTCLPGRFVGELAHATADCPAPGAGWQVFRHRTAVAVPGSDFGDTSTPPRTALVSAKCSYVWVGDGPVPDGTLPTDQLALHPLCIDEPAPPAELLNRACPASIQI